ncbi:MAG: FlgD immunoglobulin-like domain containing protein [Candidatus Eisenbacteria bacterium]
MRFSTAPVLAASLLVLSALSVAPFTARADDGAVTLTWTAPGDDSLTGTATAYDLRYFSLPITVANFMTCFRADSTPRPLAPGREQSASVRGLSLGAYYYFAIRTVDDAGNWSAMSNVVHIQAGYSLAVGNAPVEIAFSPPFPNPARGTASFTLALPIAADVEIEAYDVSGRRVRTLARGVRGAGRETLVWDLNDDGGHALGSGLYLVRARLGPRTFIRRMTVTR